MWFMFEPFLLKKKKKLRLISDLTIGLVVMGQGGREPGRLEARNFQKKLNKYFLWWHVAAKDRFLIIIFLTILYLWS